MKNKTATRDRLINAGISLIKVNSVQKLTLRQIAHEAGVTTGAFYKSFPNRQVYFRELANKVSSEWAAIIEPELARIPLATERLLFLGDNLMRTIVAQPNLAHFVLETPVVSFSDDELAKWPLLNLTFRNVKAVLDEHSRIDKNSFFIQIWIFIIGYANLLQSKSISYDPELLKTTLEKLLED